MSKVSVRRIRSANYQSYGGEVDLDVTQAHTKMTFAQVSRLAHAIAVRLAGFEMSKDEYDKACKLYEFYFGRDEFSTIPVGGK